MSPRTSQGRAWLSSIAFLCVVALVVVAALAFALNRPSANRYSAMLTTVIGLYPGADVRVLGVPVGKIDSVEPQGQLVRVNFEVNRNIKVPAEALAAVVAPTVVADRYLQLAPPYDGGPTLAPGTVIPKERTASPAEFDDLLASAQKLSSSLGPRGVNNSGALSDALHTFAQNLNGNGAQINTTLDNTAQAINTLAASRDNLAGTVRNLQSFTSNLKDDDGQVRAFTHQFAQVSGYLADERSNLGETLKKLSETLGELAKFVHDNRDRIHSNVDKLADIVGTVNDERLALEQVLDTAGPGLDGLVNGYNASAGTLDTRPNLLKILLCGLYGAFPAPLQALLGPPLNQFLASIGGIGSCANPTAATSFTLPGSLKTKLSDPTVLNMLKNSVGRSGTAGPALPTVVPPAGGGQSTDRDESGSDSARKPTKPRGPASLGDLFGGGR